MYADNSYNTFIDSWAGDAQNFLSNSKGNSAQNFLSYSSVVKDGVGLSSYSNADISSWGWNPYAGAPSDSWGLSGPTNWGDPDTSLLGWYLYESALPGPYGQPMSEWGAIGPTEWGDPMKYTEEAGGAWMWAERGAVGTAVVATSIAGGALAYEAVTGDAILAEGSSGTRIFQIRPEGGQPWFRFDWGPVPGRGSLPHWHLPPDLTKHLPWDLF